MLISGVYAIRNILNSKCYFGSTVDWLIRRKRVFSTEQEAIAAAAAFRSGVSLGV